jgi:hypothetical protein
MSEHKLHFHNPLCVGDLRPWDEPLEHGVPALAASTSLTVLVL